MVPQVAAAIAAAEGRDDGRAARCEGDVRVGGGGGYGGGRVGVGGGQLHDGGEEVLQLPRRHNPGVTQLTQVI